MAETVLSELETSTRQRFMPLVTNQIYEGSPVTERIFKASQEGDFGLALPSFDGREIVEPLEVGYVTAQAKGGATDVTDSVGAYSTSTTWAAGEQDILSGAHYTWKMYHVTLKIHNLRLAENQGASRIIDIAAVKMRNATKRLRKAVLADFYSTNVDGATGMIGMQGALQGDPGSETLIGGIDMDTNSWWRGYHDSTTTVLTWDALNAMWYDTKRFGDQDPATVMFCAPGVLEAYENSLSKRVSTGVAGTGYFSGTQFGSDISNKRVAMGGYDAFFFKNIPMIEDRHAPASTLMMVNENYLNWRVLKNFMSTGWQDLRPQGKDYLQMTINGYGALTFSALQKHGRFSNITEA